jgi:hypothetical protein
MFVTGTKPCSWLVEDYLDHETSKIYFEVKRIRWQGSR